MDNLSQLWLIGAMSIAVYVLWRGQRRRWAYLREQKESMSATVPLVAVKLAKSKSEPHALLSDAPDDLLRWQVEMHEVARDVRAELDSKIRVLQSLMIQARQEQMKLSMLCQRAEQLGVAACRDVLAEIQTAADGMGTVASREALDRLPPVPDLLAGDWPNCPDRKAQIGALAQEGLSPAAIADRLGLRIGDVELLLSLRTK